MNGWQHGRWLRPAGMILLGLVLTGCATPRIDWAARIGIYTYDQAVLDLGPPDKDAKLGDGTVVADWLVRRGYSYAYSPWGYGYWPWWYGPHYPGYAEVYSSPNQYLRLAFGPDGKLKSWKHFYQ